jgi:hypothetical protein
MKVKIHGPVSIGNHLSQASRRLDWSVDLCDLDPKALERTKNQIYRRATESGTTQSGFSRRAKRRKAALDSAVMAGPIAMRSIVFLDLVVSSFDQRL